LHDYDDADDLSFNIYAGCDDTYLSRGGQRHVISTDTADADSANGMTGEDDSVECLLMAPTRTSAWARVKSAVTVITASNAYREVEAGNPGFGENAAWPKTASTALATPPVPVSLATLNRKPGDVLGFTVAVNDDDAGSHETQLL
jgi:hypothetical protein